MKNYKLIFVGLIFFLSSISAYAGCSTRIYGLSGSFITEVNKTITLDFRHDYIDFGFGKIPIKTCVLNKSDSLDVTMNVDLPPEQGGESMITIGLRGNIGHSWGSPNKIWDKPPTYPINYTISSLDKGQITESGKMSLLNSDSRTNMSSIPIVENTSGGGGWSPDGKTFPSGGVGGWDPSSENKQQSNNSSVPSNVYRNNSTEYTFPNGNRYVGMLENGLPNGVGSITAPDGTKYEGMVSRGMISGHGIMYYTNGSRREGEFLNGFQNGFGTYFYNNGVTVVGVFKNGYPTNTAVYTDKDGNYFHGNYNQDAPYNGDIYNAANQSIGKVINGKNSYYKVINQQASNQQNQSNGDAGNVLGKIFGAVLEGISGYQEGKNAARSQQQTPIVKNPQDAPVIHQGYIPLPQKPMPAIILPPLPELPPMQAPNGKISG